jgi:DNA-binding NarL/FixJ family response regulator
MVRILLADDHDIVRHGLRSLLEREEGWEVCREARNGREAVEMAGALAPDVTMPELNGLDATRRIRAAGLATEILIFTMHEIDELVARCSTQGRAGT